MSLTGTSPAPTRPEGDLSKQYRPADHESRIWERWMAADAFRADPSRVVSGEKEPYCILIPPPNVTAALHLGHALNNTLQDILIRAHRMKGFETLWMPGTDHAGIATQAVVEKRLRKEGKLKGPLKDAMQREEFIAHVQAFKDEYEAVITGQLKKMGCSCDWARQRFTMDETCARAVREAFFILFRDGLIYRGKRLVNWDPALQTAVADDECYEEEVDSFFYYLRYPLVHPEGMTTTRERARNTAAPSDAVPVTWDELASRGFLGAEQHPADEPAWITVATTRPETFLGDTAVAINPRDPRAKALRGLCVELPLIGRVIPIVEDDYVVLPAALARTEEEKNDPKAAFATGFLKVTPAHDVNDYELGQRHAKAIEAAGNPVMVNMMSPDGRVSDRHGWSNIEESRGALMLLGKTMAEARKLVVKEFEARGLHEASKPYRHTLKFSDRSKAVIEPYLSDQWYVRVTDPRLAARANAALAPEQRSGSDSDRVGRASPPHPAEEGDGSLRFFPARYSRTYEHWHDNIRDWCISRQLWWGHRIPVWTRDFGIGDASLLGAAKIGIDAGIVTLKLAPWEDTGRIAVRDSRTAPDAPGHAPTNYGADARAPFSVCVRDPEGDDRGIVEYLERHGFRQDPDVLDTWFSSALWPLSTLGWPDPERAAEETGIADFPLMLDAFNPSTTLCTAREIITLWVSRMVMFNRYLKASGAGHGALDAAADGPRAMPVVSPPPFRNVFVHAVVMDGEGRKMSKTLGNGVDPLDIIQTHGTDAMRFTLCQMTTQTQDVRLPVRKDANGRNTSEKFDLGRNFANKLWNAARFALGILGAGGGGGGRVWSADSLADRWLLSRLAGTVAACDASLSDFEFAAYAQTLYDFVWRDFCDWYLEAIKPTVAQNPSQRAVLRASLDTILRLLHPVMPFVTETIHEHLRAIPAMDVPGVVLRGNDRAESDLLATSAWPRIDPSLRNESAEAAFDRMRGLVTAIRDVRAKHMVKPSRRIVLHTPPSVGGASTFDAEQRSLIATFAGLREISSMPAPTTPGGSVAFTFESSELRLSDLADAEAPEQAAAASEAEKTRLTKQIADLTKAVGVLEARLNNPGYADKAPAPMVQQSREQLAAKKSELAAAQAALVSLG